MQKRVPAPPIVPDFTPVPRKYRHDGWTAERQRAFIDALAQTGSVKAAARKINMSSEGAYYLRRQPGAESFRAAWEAALDHGVQCLTDIAIDRALEGVPVPVFYKGEVVGEKRWFNDRLLMFVLKHHLRDRYGRDLPRGTRHPDTVAREEAEEADGNDAAALEQIFRLYGAKVAAERGHRHAGEIEAADFVLRQIVQIELMLVCGGHAARLVAHWIAPPEEGDAPPWHEPGPASEMIEEARRAAWAKSGEPDRPALPLLHMPSRNDMWGGPTAAERIAARRRAESRLEEAQREWQAAAKEESWAAWLAGERRQINPA